MKRTLLAVLLVPFLLIACVDVPTTTIKVPTANGLVVIKAPKDSKIAGLKANFEKGTVQLDSYEAKMNPDVIGASALGQVELIKAYGDLANSMAAIGLRAFAASQGMPLAGPAAPPQQVSQQITPQQLDAMIQKRAEEIANQRATVAATNRPSPLRNPRIRPGSTNAPPTVSTNAPAH